MFEVLDSSYINSEHSFHGINFSFKNIKQITTKELEDFTEQFTRALANLNTFVYLRKPSKYRSDNERYKEIWKNILESCKEELDLTLHYEKELWKRLEVPPPLNEELPTYNEVLVGELPFETMSRDEFYSELEKHFKKLNLYTEVLVLNILHIFKTFFEDMYPYSREINDERRIDKTFQVQIEGINENVFLITNDITLLFEEVGYFDWIRNKIQQSE